MQRDLAAPRSFPTRRSSDLGTVWDPGAVRDAKDAGADFVVTPVLLPEVAEACRQEDLLCVLGALTPTEIYQARLDGADRKSTRLNSSHVKISYAVFCL